MRASSLFVGAACLIIMGFMFGESTNPAVAVGLGLMWMGIARI